MFYRIVRAIALGIAHLLFNISYEGLENIPQNNKGYILACNHRTMLDPVFCVTKIKQPFSFMAKEELFKNRIIGAFLSALGAFPVSRGSGDMGVIEEADQRIENGSPLLIFPEGTRSKDGLPGRGRLGISLIAGQTHADVLPCTIDYGVKLRFRSKVTVKYHPVLTPEELNIDPEIPATMREASRSIMDSIVSGMTHLPALEAAKEEKKQAALGAAKDTTTSQKEKNKKNKKN